MSKHKYTAHVRVEGGTEEVQFEPQADAPRIPSKYQNDSKELGKYKDGEEYAFGPDEEQPKKVTSVKAGKWGKRAAKKSSAVDTAKVDEPKPISEPIAGVAEETKADAG